MGGLALEAKLLCSSLLLGGGCVGRNGLGVAQPGLGKLVGPPPSGRSARDLLLYSGVGGDSMLVRTLTLDRPLTVRRAANGLSTSER